MKCLQCKENEGTITSGFQCLHFVVYRQLGVNPDLKNEHFYKGAIDKVSNNA